MFSSKLYDGVWRAVPTWEGYQEQGREGGGGRGGGRGSHKGTVTGYRRLVALLLACCSIVLLFEGKNDFAKNSATQ